MYGHSERNEAPRLKINDEIATVDLSSEYEQGSGSWAESLRLAQVVYTLTQFETFKRVNFRLEGKPVELFAGHGLILNRRRAAGLQGLSAGRSGPKVTVASERERRRVIEVCASSAEDGRATPRLDPDDARP